MADVVVSSSDNGQKDSKLMDNRTTAQTIVCTIDNNKIINRYNKDKRKQYIRQSKRLGDSCLIIR